MKRGLALSPSGRGLGEGLFRAMRCLAAPHPDPLPEEEREQVAGRLVVASLRAADDVGFGLSSTTCPSSPAKAGAQDQAVPSLVFR